MIISDLADLVLHSQPNGIMRVAVDGPDAAGKTTLAAEIATRVRRRGRSVIQASVDAFHQPRALRRRRGSLSAEGYYYDAFDYVALRRCLLEPLGPDGDRRYRTAVFDLGEDAPLSHAAEYAPRDAVLVVDGVFLLRAELRDCWDLTVHLRISPEESLRRALVRDVDLFGSAAAVQQRYEERYLPGQELYRAHAAPHEHADILIDDENPQAPRVRRWLSEQAAPTPTGPPSGPLGVRSRAAVSGPG